jgi:hypothetical protein
MEKLQTIFGRANDIKDNKQVLKKPKQLIWNVFNCERTENGNEIVIVNVFDLNWPFLAVVYDAYKNYKDDFDNFSKEVRSALMYEYWSRFEYEIIISTMSEYQPKGVKIDIYQQVMMNWDNFINYLWENKNLIKNFKPEYKRLNNIYKRRYL